MEGYKPLPVSYLIRWSILDKINAGHDPLSLIEMDGRDQTKLEMLNVLLTGSFPYLVSEEGTGKTKLAKSLAKLLPPIPAIKGCMYHDDPKWSKNRLCPRCSSVKDPVKEYDFEFITGEERVSRIQGNEYTNKATLLGFKDIQQIVNGKTPSDPSSFTGTGIFHGNRGIVFIDELPSIPTKVQVLLHPVLQENMVVLEEYNWKRPVDTILIATGNPENFSHVNKIPRPLMDRIEFVGLPLPDEKTERQIMLKERFRGQEYDLTNDVTKLSETGLFSVDQSVIERQTIVPWWLASVITKSVRYARQCENLEKGPSLRGDIQGIDHASSSTELRKRYVCRLEDVCDGLKPAFRGRMKVRPDLVESPEYLHSITDDLTVDLIRYASENVGNEIYETRMKKDERLKTEIKTCLDGSWKSFVEKVESGKHKLLYDLTFWMFSQTPNQVDAASLNEQEKLLYDNPTNLKSEVLTEAVSSALQFVVNIAAYKKEISEAEIGKKVFIPPKYNPNKQRSDVDDES
jgi:Mg-chelatase subunit ChlI